MVKTKRFFDEKEAFKKQKIATLLFQKWYPHLPKETISDFGAYCFEQWYSGRYFKTPVEWLAIDFLRKFENRVGTRGSSDVLACSDRISFDSNPGYAERYGRDSPELRGFDESSLLRDRRLSQIQRACLVLYFKWGLSEKEIADCFGFTESRACQLKKIAQALVSKSLSFEEQRSREFEKPSSLSPKIQTQSYFGKKESREVESIRENERPRLGEFKIEEISESLFETFELTAF